MESSVLIFIGPQEHARVFGDVLDSIKTKRDITLSMDDWDSSTNISTLWKVTYGKTYGFLTFRMKTYGKTYGKIGCHFLYSRAYGKTYGFLTFRMFSYGKTYGFWKNIQKNIRKNPYVFPYVTFHRATYAFMAMSRSHSLWKKGSI
jgi:hypothetical protein